MTFATLLDVYIILAIAFPRASYCASFGLPLCVHPLRCLSAGILRDVFLRASSKMTFECILRDALRVCILRGALMCAYVEVACYVHPSRCLVVFILRGALMWDVRGEFQEKRLPPSSRMAHQGSLSKSLVSFG